MISSTETSAGDRNGQSWTLADILSTYRYWALFLTSLFLALGAQSFSIGLPTFLQRTAGTAVTLGFFYSTSSFGWLIGGAVAVVAAARSPKLALLPFILLCIISIALLLVPAVWNSALLLGLSGLCMGSVRIAALAVTASVLASGRSAKIDFAAAFVLMTAGSLIGTAFAGVAVSLIYDSDGVNTVFWFPLICYGCAFLAPAFARPLDFDGSPRIRYAPLAFRRRSPLLIGSIAILIPVVVVLCLVLLYEARFSDTNDTVLVVALCIWLVCLCAGIYLLYCCYRIHGELAGQEPSQRLLTPVAATLITIFIPLGMVAVLATLGDVLNARAQRDGGKRALSMTWLTVWAIFAPPIAVAMIQNALNKLQPAG
jgi:MFS family permease